MPHWQERIDGDRKIEEMEKENMALIIDNEQRERYRADEDFSDARELLERQPVMEAPPANPTDFQPLYNFVLLKVLDKGDYKVGAIYMPQRGQKVTDGAKYAKVIAVGDGRLQENGTMIPLKVKAGDEVYFAQLAGAEIRLGGETYLISREEEIFGVIRRS